MSLEFITEYYIPIVLAACLIVDFIPNKYIPLILAILGAVLGCMAKSSITLETVVYGAFTGLASTGLHQAFTRLIEGESEGE